VHDATSPSSNHTCGFPAYGFPRIAAFAIAWLSFLRFRKLLLIIIPIFPQLLFLVLVVDGGIISKNPEGAKPSTRPNRQEKHDLLDKAVFATAQEARQFRRSYRKVGLMRNNKLIYDKACHREAIHSTTILVATFGDTPIQLTRAEPSLDRYRLEENVGCNELRTLPVPAT
jgi:hypothetical protein